MNVSDFINTYPTQIIIIMMIIIIILIIILIVNVKSKEGFDIGAFNNVEFRSADDPKLCIHKLGNDTKFSIDRKLHWWNELNHNNSKHTLEYSLLNKTFNVYRIEPSSNIIYRWHFTDCSKQTNIGFYPSSVPTKNDLFKFEWQSNDVCIIKTECGLNVGGIIGHDKDILSGKDVKPAKIKLYSYNLNRYLTKNDFLENDKTTDGLLSKLSKNETVNELTTASNSVGKVNIVASKTEKFNLKYGAYYLIPKKNGGIVYLECTSSSPSQQFEINKNKQIIIPTLNNMILRGVKEINVNQNSGEGIIIFDRELIGDGRYCNGRNKKSSDARIRKIYLEINQMPILKCGNSKNVNYIPIKELKVDKYVKI